jgi:hypothetical protein
MLTSKTVEIQPQMFKKVYTFYDDIIQGYKAQKTETINNSTIEFNGWVFDSDEKSIGRMSRYLQISTITMLKDQSNGMTTSDAWQKNYVDNKIQGKLNDKNIQEISVEQLFEVYTMCVHNMSNNWLK